MLDNTHRLKYYRQQNATSRCDALNNRNKKGKTQSTVYENTENIQERLKNTDFGAHHLLVYPNLTALRQVYSHYIDNALNSKNETVIVLPFFETADTVKKVLRESEFNIDVSKNQRQHSLVVIDSLKGYFSSGGISSLIEQALEHTKKSGKNGLSVFGDAGSYFYRHKDNELVDYELSLPSHYDEGLNLKTFCLYHKQDFNSRLTEEQKQNVLEHHGKSMVIT
jgi:hypothetical protein